LSSTLRAEAAGAWSGAPGSGPRTCAPSPPVAVPLNRWPPGRTWPEPRFLTGNSMEVVLPVMGWTYASGQRKHCLDGHLLSVIYCAAPRGRRGWTGNPDWSSCRKGRRAQMANRWAVGGATRRVAVRFKRPSGRRTRLSRARLGTAARVPRGTDDPQGPNRPGAGGFARRPPGRGSWGLSFSSSGHPHRAPTPGSATYQGGIPWGARRALLHSVSSRRAEAAADAQDQMTMASSLNATVSRRFACSSTASS
jgi:hypothetical protein